jgi:hypothetical protein
MTSHHSQRHQRRVTQAGHRVGALDESGAECREALRWLSRCRAEAVSVGHDQKDVDSWAMNGLCTGREDAWV